MSWKNGKPCKRCGASEWGNRGRCKQCARDNAAKWRQNNPERHRENSRRWEIENPELAKETKRQWRETNAESIKDRRRKYYEANKKTIRERARQWRQENIETVKERSRRWYEANKDADNKRRRKHYEANAEATKQRQSQWRKSNPDTVRAVNQQRRARKAGNGGSFTKSEWQSLLESCDYRCLGCGRNDVRLTVDHVVPISMGGTNSIDNIQPLCSSCNSRKSARHIDYRTKPGLLRWIQLKLFD